VLFRSLKAWVFSVGDPKNWTKLDLEPLIPKNPLVGGNPQGRKVHGKGGTGDDDRLVCHAALPLLRVGMTRSTLV